MSKVREGVIDVFWALVSMCMLAVLSLPLALSIFVAITIWLLPWAIGQYLSWAHILSILNGPGAPHDLFLDAKFVFKVSWIITLGAKLMVLADDQNIARMVRGACTNRHFELASEDVALGDAGGGK
ncbi:hypothetical protein [Acidithiobacillus ferridurans]|uniref:Uncharacterized protein n=1 Tax=Acidithiobacillus ferridurans TaxID=1232575 RepID=A0A8X8GBM0_ACIFI|nr:hypothetical protein [Acidithiobacillus ferridurans]MBU2715818.1 hypothetical protein [Acidithiobacillus ferridurans]MBU2722815.1 hypothetical protein [Acidithiobacillus ferridurans]MBU2727798.1 hypothetical protein [Acidithiobacillus ferridurans]